MSVYRQNLKTREKHNAYHREYRKRNIEKMRAYNREYNKKWRERNGYHNETKWATNNYEKVKVYNKLRYAVRLGRVIKKPCAVCDKPETVAHHFDYTKPLEVIWLCKPHHRANHYGRQ